MVPWESRGTHTHTSAYCMQYLHQYCQTVRGRHTLPYHACVFSCADVLTMHSFLHVPINPQVLACIGEQFDEGDEVCGVTVNIRNGKDRLELWSKTAANEALQMSVGKQLKQMLDIPDSNKIGFVVFVSACLVQCIHVLLQCLALLHICSSVQWFVHIGSSCACELLMLVLSTKVSRNPALPFLSG